MRTLAVLAILFTIACSKDGDNKPKCTTTVGACDAKSASCGIELLCKGGAFRLDCTPPVSGETKILCRCTSQSMYRDITIELPFGTPEKPFTTDPERIVADACHVSL